MLYSYDALGLGHVRRMISIAGAVLARRSDLATLLVSCSPQLDALPMPAGLDYIKLPSARKLDNDRYVSRTLRIGGERLRGMRASLLYSAVRTFRPHFLLVDKSPNGLRGELSGALHLVRSLPDRARLALGWRDILDDSKQVSAEWSAHGTLAEIERHYDEVWVYGDPAVFDMRVEYALPERVAERVRYLGYLAPRVDPEARAHARARLAGPGDRLAVVTVGGGEDGEVLLSCYLEAARRGLLPRDLRSLVVAGPFLSPDALRRLRAVRAPGVRVVRFLPGLEAAVAAADVVVAMAGYNTICEVLGAGTPAVLAPRVSPRLEQLIRARRLSALGITECLEPPALHPVELADATRRAIARPRGRCAGLRLDGLDRVVERIRRVLPEDPMAAAVPLDPCRGIPA